jgi:DNA-directed RNA polymerase specialized sigma subunit
MKINSKPEITKLDIPRRSEPPRHVPGTDKYRESWTNWKATQTPEAMGKFLRDVDPIITSAVKSYAGMSTPTIHSKAKVMAAKAMLRYDPKKGNISTFLMNELKGISRESMRETRAIRIPERIMYDSRRIVEAEDEFKSVYMREPTLLELADKTGLSEKRISYIRNVTMPLLHEGSNVSAETGEPSLTATNVPDIDEMSREYVYRDLDPIDKLIFDHRFGAHGKKRLGVIDLAARIKISPASISQRAKKISGLIDEVRGLHERL